MVERSPRDATAKPPALARVVPWLSRERSWRETAFLLRVRWRALLRGLDRRHLRSNEIALTVLSALVGMAVGFGVALVRQMMQWMHVVAYGMSPYHLLSEGIGLTWWRVLLVPVIGGVVVGVATVIIRRWRPREVVDAIEANALYGGKMSLIDSANLTLLTLLSGGLGASVGMEAAYTQLGAGFASNVGELMRTRRNDLRTLVGGGAAGLGIVTMLGVTWIERGFRRQSIPLWARPAIGGAVVGLMAFFWPQVLGSGHGAIESVIGRNFPPLALLLLIPAEAIALAGIS